MGTPQLGTAAPDVSLPGLVLTSDGGGESVTHGTYSLGAERGHPVVLAFYPADDTPTCTAQMCAYSAGLDDIAAAAPGAVVWGISTQGLDSHERFARRHGLRLPLLADDGGAAARAYGVGTPLGVRRSVFVVDAAGVLRWKHVALVGLSYQDVATLRDALSALAPA